MEAKYCKESRVIRTSRVFPNDVNNHNAFFGGRLMSDLDQVASIAAARHSRRECVTASTDSVDFLYPVRPTDSVCFESYVSWTGTSSMEIFVKIIAEDLNPGERKIAATAFLTFVALDEHKLQRVFHKSFQKQKKKENYMKLHQIGQDYAKKKTKK